VVGVVFGGLAMRRSAAGAAKGGAPNELAREARSLTVLGAATAKAAAGPATSTSAEPVKPTTFLGGARPTSPSTPPVVGAKPVVKPNAACDPPYTIDPATGRKKYKMECLK
jgi:hypothetical protein